MSEMENLRECAIGKLGTGDGSVVKTDVFTQVGRIEDVIATLPVLYRLSRETGLDIDPTVDACANYVRAQLRSIESVVKTLGKMLHDAEESLSTFRTSVMAGPDGNVADPKEVLQGLFPDVITNFGTKDAEDARKWTEKLHMDGVIDGDGNPRFDQKPKNAARTGRKASRKSEKASPDIGEVEK